MEDTTNTGVNVEPVQTDADPLINPAEALGYDTYVNANMPDGFTHQDVDDALMGYAKENNLSRTQLNNLRKMMLDNIIQEDVDDAKAKADNLTKSTMELQQEWGNTFNFRINNINKVIDKADNDGSMRKYLSESGLDSDPRFVRMMDRFVSAMNGEDPIKTSKQAVIETPESVQEQINRLTANKAYFDANDPNHSFVVNQITKLYEKLYQE